jgi:ABC-type antimicrobial peptide transport system permease subunit
MTFADLAGTSLGNLWRMKLRTFLTVSGVVVAIAACVSMLSFGVGMQQNVAEQFDNLGLLSIIQVYPSRSDTTETVPLDRAALNRFAALPGVELVYPYESFDVTVAFGDSTVRASAQALPAEALDTRMFSNLRAGSKISSDTASQVMMGDELLERLGVDSVELTVGSEVVLSIEVASVDSGIAEIFGDAPDRIRERARAFRVDSLRSAGYWQRVVREEFSGAIGRFVDGFLNKRKTVADTLVIGGVLESRRHGHSRLGDLVVPISTARKFNSSGFSGDPTQLLSAAQGGNLFSPEADTSSATFSRATVKMASDALYEPIRDSIRAAGFRAVSFAEEFDEIRRFFRYFNLALGMVGIIALFTASLGIVNTMVMSITERRREIGVWMSLGADTWDIRRLFLFESGMIGLIGAAGGIVIGWGISRVASLVVRTFMENEGVTPMELFAVPIWLVLTALSFGLLVALIAGYYPANRAAKIDPVAALRNE